MIDSTWRICDLSGDPLKSIREEIHIQDLIFEKSRNELVRDWKQEAQLGHHWNYPDG